MTESQRRALWATAFTNLARAILDGYCKPPSSVHLWTQYVSPGELLSLADVTYDTPLPIKIHPGFATIRVPTGELLGLPIDWTIQCDLGADDLNRTNGFGRDSAVKAFEVHNEECADTTASAQPSASDD